MQKSKNRNIKYYYNIKQVISHETNKSPPMPYIPQHRLMTETFQGKHTFNDKLMNLS